MSEIRMIDGADSRMVADWLEKHLAAALDTGDGLVAITVPGGSTPFPIMQELITRGLEWSRLVVWPGDDRIVPEGHEASNSGKIRALFEPVGADVQALSDDAKPPHFALAWLGMGGDGHIASLFPNTDPKVDDLQAVRRLTPDPLPSHAPFDRITLTLPALLASDALLFTLGGAADKREVFEAAMAGEDDLPVSRLLAAAGQSVTCFT